VSSTINESICTQKVFKVNNSEQNVSKEKENNNTCYIGIRNVINSSFSKCQRKMLVFFILYIFLEHIYSN